METHMLRIEIDTFSGRPNPAWIITDRAKTEKFLRAVGDMRGAMAKQGAGFSGLGFREVWVSLVSDDIERPKGVPAQFALASIASTNFLESGQLARQLIEVMPARTKIRLPEHQTTPLSSTLRDRILEQLDRYLNNPPQLSFRLPSAQRSPLRRTTRDENCINCEYEMSHFAPAFWNTPIVRLLNNCYNYACCRRTDTQAQPGRAHGAEARKLNCSQLITSALADGLLARCNCLPDSEYPRHFLALAVEPGGYDFHWYRKQLGDFWGHKIGPTAATNVDNSNNLVIDPETCNRGTYTEFCGYFYAGRSVMIR
jgi:hypothetical protein